MIRSMTGFGAAEGLVGAERFTIEIRAVNHRFFSPAIKLPGALARWEPEVRDALRKTITRGHVTVTARIERDATSAPAVIDEARFAAYVDQLRGLQKRHDLGDGLELSTVLRMPDLIAGAREQEAGSAAELVQIVEHAASALNASRAAEGARLSGFLLERLGTIEAGVERLAGRAPLRLLEQRDRLRANVAELTGGVELDSERLEQEIALLADRLDVSEELDRFRSHFAAFRQTLASASPDGVGKRLGFLLQELLREANTTGSKANDAIMTQDVVTIKEELERIREQVENLE